MPKFVHTIFFILLASYTFAGNSTYLGDYSNSDATKFGTIKIVGKFGDSHPEKLLINNKQVKIFTNKDDDGGDHVWVMNIDNRIILPNAVVYSVWGGTGGSMDANVVEACKFVTILPHNKYKISQLTYCFDGTTVSIESGDIVQIKYTNGAAYAESTDIEIHTYNYMSNKITVVTKIKDDEYYTRKFANWTPKQIYQEALNDKSVDKQTGLIYADSDHISRRKYCFKFEALKNPPHDKYYDLLDKSCTED